MNTTQITAKKQPTEKQLRALLEHGRNGGRKSLPPVPLEQQRKPVQVYLSEIEKTAILERTGFSSLTELVRAVARGDVKIRK
jgi:hypothetical protein